ncbi:MAG: amylosucrase [Clostridiales bacterium]|nr:amylosucrase [Clostridiales bacterium]
MTQEFQTRLASRYDELRQLYCALYPGREDTLTGLLSAMEGMYRARPEDLKRSDRQRESDPGWYRSRERLGMMLYVKPFAGDLNGVRERLDYLQECGVNYLHLMPLLESPRGRSDGGYAVSDFRRVQPELGTMDDLEALTGDCRRRGISVCLDFVMNHTSEDHEWARRARAGEREYQERYFFYDNWDIPNLYERTVPQVFPTDAPGNFTWQEELGKVVMTTFYPYQWDLNYANPTVFREMTENLLFLTNRGIDVIRLDAVPYIWKQLGTNCRNLPQVHTLVRMLRIVTEIVCPGVLLLGEVVMEPALVAPYFGTPERPECHMLYNVTAMCTTWHTAATHDVRLLRHQLNQVAALPKGYTFQNYLRCHDDIGWGLDYPFLAQFGMGEVPHKRFLNDYFTGKLPYGAGRGTLYNDDERLGDARLCGTTASLCGLETALETGSAAMTEQALSLDLMLHACMLSQSGIPVLYAGDEVGQRNDWGYLDDPEKAGDSRYLHRGDFRWDEAELRQEPDTVQGRLFRGLRQMETVRQSAPVFDADADFWTADVGNDAVLALGRYKNGEKLYGLYNFSPEPQKAWLDETGDYTDLMGERQVVNPGVLTLGGYEFLWLAKQV